MFRRRNNKEQEKDNVLEKEVIFWKTEMEKVVNEKNTWVAKYMQASEDNEMLRAELFLFQQDAQSVRAQFEVLRKREECRMAAVVAAASQSPTVGVGSSAGTPQSAAAAAAAGCANGLGPSPASASTTPVKSTTPLRGGGGHGLSSYDKSTVHQLEEQVADLKAELSRAHRQLAAAEAAAHTADMRVALLEERLAEATREAEAARRQTEFMRATAEAHQREAAVLRSEVLSQRSINDETANETTKILSELSAAQQRCAKLASEVSIKEQMIGLLQLQLGDMAAAAASNGGAVCPAMAVPGAAVSLASALNPSGGGGSVSLASLGPWGIAVQQRRRTTSSGFGGIGGFMEDVVVIDDGSGGGDSAEAEVEAEGAVAEEAVSGGTPWLSPKTAVDIPQHGGKSPSLGDGGSRGSSAGGGVSGGDVDCNTSLDHLRAGASAAVAVMAATASLDGSPASAASPTACQAFGDGGSGSVVFEFRGVEAEIARGGGRLGRPASAAAPELNLSVPKIVAAAAVAEAASAAACPRFQEVAMQVDLAPSLQSPAVLRKSLSKGFAAATAAAATAPAAVTSVGEPTTVLRGGSAQQPVRQHHQYHQQRPANVPQLHLSAAFRAAAAAAAATSEVPLGRGAAANDAVTIDDDISGTNSTGLVGKRGVADQPKAEEGEAPAAKRVSVYLPPVVPAACAATTAAAAAPEVSAGADEAPRCLRDVAKGYHKEASAAQGLTTGAPATSYPAAVAAVASAQTGAAPTSCLGPESAVAQFSSPNPSSLGTNPPAAIAPSVPTVQPVTLIASFGDDPTLIAAGAAAAAAAAGRLVVTVDVDNLTEEKSARKTADGADGAAGMAPAAAEGPEDSCQPCMGTSLTQVAEADEEEKKKEGAVEKDGLSVGGMGMVGATAAAAAGAGGPVKAEAEAVVAKEATTTEAGLKAEVQQQESNGSIAASGDRGEISGMTTQAGAAPASSAQAAGPPRSISSGGSGGGNAVAMSGSGNAAAAGTATTSPAPSVHAPKIFRFPGARMAAAAAAGAMTQHDKSEAGSSAGDVPKTPIAAARRGSDGGGGNSAVTVSAFTPKVAVAAVMEAPAAAGTPGGGNGSTPVGISAISRASSGGSSTLSLLKRFNSGGLGSEPARTKSPAPEGSVAAAAAAEGVFAGSGLSGVAAAIRRISGAGSAPGIATPQAAQTNGAGSGSGGAGSGIPEPSPHSQQPTPPRRPAGTGVSTLLNKFNTVSGGSGTGPSPPPAPGNSSGGSGTVVVPEYGIGGPASRVPASAKIAAMRSAYEKNKL